MEINPNRSLNRIEHTKRKGKPGKPSASVQADSSGSGASEAVSLASLEEEITSLPEVRSEKIKEGEVLAKDPNYPDREELSSVGKLLIENVLREGLSEG